MSDGLKVIAAAIAVGSASALIQLDSSLFLDNETAAFEYVRGFYRQYRQLPELRTVQEQTGVRFPVATENLNFYVDRVYERSEYNQIRDRFGALREGMTQMDMPRIFSAVESMHAVTRQRNRRNLESMDIGQAVDLSLAHIDRARGSGGISGIETGWPVYDSITGGYQRGDLISLVGRPETGKTYLALRQAWAAHQAGASVLFVTTEMSIEQIGRRHIALQLGINPSYLKNGTISTYTERRIRSLYTGFVGAERFRIFAVGMKSQVSAVEAFIQEFDPDLVVIDGAYLLKPTQQMRSNSRTERITAVLDEVKALTLDCDKPFLITTQFNRQAGRGGVDGTLENIGYSDAIGTHSSLVIAVRFGPTTNPRQSRWLTFLKGREGETGSVAINFKFAPLDMDEFTPGNDGAQAPDGTPEAPNVDWMG